MAHWGEHVPRALRLAREALHLEEDEALAEEQANVFYQYLLLERLGKAEARFWRENRSPKLRARLEQLLEDLSHPVSPNLSGFEPGLAEPLYRRRLIDLAMERILGERLAPETCLLAEPMENLKFPGMIRHAVIFAAVHFFTHEFYPLAVDALVRDLGRYGKPRFSLLGVHVDWLDENGNLRRLLYADFERHCFFEADLRFPLRPDSIQFLCLGEEEQDWHRRLSARLDYPQANPAEAAEPADDKSETLAGWSALSVEISAFKTIACGDLTAVREFMARHGDCVIKPNRGTEGKEVTYFRRGNWCEADLERCLKRCWQLGPAIVQERRDGLLYLAPQTGERHSLALRLNLVFDGAGWRLQSGYAQLGRDAETPASVGRGGSILPLDEVLPHLARRRESEKPTPRLDENCWSLIREQAERAAILFEGLLLVGLDLLLDVDSRGAIIPVFLEANPRPAGLSRSRLLAQSPFSPAQPGVGLRFWDGLENLIQQRRKTGIST
ncbi:MAG: hypothetical protein PHE55_03885 [Methylococcaceae bacterium]|nr:hypothetical protein [Methylococcaceae bacterium]